VSVARLCAVVAAAAMLSGCAAGSPPTCDDYAQADPIARKMMISDELQQHGLEPANPTLQIQVAESVVRQCGPVDPYGHVPAQKNGSQPFAETVNWAGLRSG